MLVILNDGTLYGANHSFLNIISALETAPVRFEVAVPTPGPVVPRLREKGIGVHVVPWLPVVAHPVGGLCRAMLNLLRRVRYRVVNARAIRRLAALARTLQVDVIHTNSSTIDVGFKAARSGGVPHLWWIRESIHAVSRGCVYGGIDEHIRNIRASDKVICSSEFLRRGLGSPPNATVVYDAVRKAASWTTAPRRAAFLCCGSLDENKNVIEAIVALAEVVKIFPKAELLVVGTGEAAYQQKLQACVEELRLTGSVRFLGYREDVDDLYRSAAALLVCSRVEGLGRVTVEAMLCGCVVIGYDSSGTAELLAGGTRGVLYRTTTELSEAMIRTLEHPAALDPLRLLARNFAEESFLERQMRAKLISVYDEVAEDTKHSD